MEIKYKVYKYSSTRENAETFDSLEKAQKYAQKLSNELIEVVVIDQIVITNECIVVPN